MFQNVVPVIYLNISLPVIQLKHCMPVVVEMVKFTKSVVHGVGEAQHIINSLLLPMNLVVRLAVQ